MDIRNWWRIQRRMLLIYAAEIWVDWLEWPFRLLLNWIIFATLPLWVGFAYMVLFVARAWKSRKYAERSVLSGKIWFWEMYRLY